jgi:transposase
MYIDVVPNRDSPPAVLLRESYRENGKVKKRTIANLSSLPPEKVEGLRQVLSGKRGVTLASDPESGPIWAVFDVLNQLSRSIGFDDALGASRIALLVKFLIIARLAHNGSRLSSVRWAEDHCVSDILSLSPFDEDNLYEALDWVANEQEQIEKKLYARYLKSKKAPPVLVLYDVTSSYFEGECNELGEYGYNRDKKSGKKQIVIGLLTDQQGEPLSVSVFKGNTADPSTLETQIDLLAQRFGINEVVMVGDRGMIKTKGKSAIHAIKYKYISAITDAQICSLMKNKLIQADFFDSIICEVEQDKKRFILKKDDRTYRKEQLRREDKINRLKKLIKDRNEFILKSPKADPLSGLKKFTGWAKKYKISAFIKLNLKNNVEIILEIDESAKIEDGLLDGCYVIETDVPKETMTTQEIHDRYRDLQRVERDFRSLKTGLLEVRPIFLRNGNRTRGHVFISMLSLKLAREMERRLQSQYQTTNEDRYTVTIPDALNALSRITLLNYKTKDQVIRVLPKPDARQKQILSALQVHLTLPSQIQSEAA